MVIWSVCKFFAVSQTTMRRRRIQYILLYLIQQTPATIMKFSEIVEGLQSVILFFFSFPR